MPESVTVGELLVRIRADVRDLEAGLQKTQLGITNLATRTAPGMRAMQNAFRGLAFSAAGVPGPIGRVSSLLLSFSLGGPVTLGVLGGLAAIGGALKLLQWHASNLEKKWKEMQERMQFVGIHELAVLEAIHGITAQDPAVRMRQIAGAMGTITHELKEWQQQAKVARDPMGQLLGERGLIPTLAELTPKIRDASLALSILRQEYNELYNKLAVTEMQALQARVLKTAGGPPRMAGSLAGLQLLGITRQLPSPEELRGRVSRLIEPFAAEIRARYESFQQIGQSIGWALADGIQAVLSGGNFFQSLARSLLGMAVNLGSMLAGRAIGNALFPGGGAVIGGLLSGGAGSRGMSKAVSPGSGLLTVAVNVPPARDPMTLARDAQWQRAFKEAALVARSSGFR